MKPLLLWVTIGAVVYFIYRDNFDSPQAVEATAATLAEPSMTDIPIPFWVRIAVQDLYEEWKSRQLGEKRPGMADPQKLLVEIKRYLFSKGEHTEAAVARTIGQVLGGIGLAPAERAHAAAEIVSMVEELEERQTSVRTEQRGQRIDGRYGLETIRSLPPPN